MSEARPCGEGDQAAIRRRTARSRARGLRVPPELNTKLAPMRRRLLPGFNCKFQTQRLGYGNQGGQARIAAGRQCTVEALALDARSLGHFCNTAPGFSHPAQGYQEHAGFVLVFQRCSQVLGGKVRALA